jgi:hypothetical protein
MRNKFNKPETYCIDCANRTDPDVIPAYTNIDQFCSIGFTQNPKTLLSTINALKNNACVCHRNPHRAKAKMLIGSAH